MADVVHRETLIEPCSDAIVKYYLASLPHQPSTVPNDDVCVFLSSTFIFPTFSHFPHHAACNRC